MRYAEENRRSNDNPWSVRQTGVYHHHVSTRDFDLFIFLHPLEESFLECQLITIAAPSHPKSELASLCANPYQLHSLAFALYSDNWRWYLRYLGEEFQEKVSSMISVACHLSDSTHRTT